MAMINTHTTIPIIEGIIEYTKEELLNMALYYYKTTFPDMSEIEQQERALQDIK